MRLSTTGRATRTLLPDGDYDFEIVDLKRSRHVPKGGGKLPECPKAEVTVRCYPADGGDYANIPHNLFLHSRCEGILCEFFRGIGQRKHGEPLRPDWSRVIGSARPMQGQGPQLHQQGRRDARDQRRQAVLRPDRRRQRNGRVLIVELRPYQLEAKDAIFREWGMDRQRTLLVLPTGTGKTIVFCSLAEEVVRRGGRVLIPGPPRRAARPGRRQTPAGHRTSLRRRKS